MTLRNQGSSLAFYGGTRRTYVRGADDAYKYRKNISISFFDLDWEIIQTSEKPRRPFLGLNGARIRGAGIRIIQRNAIRIRRSDDIHCDRKRKSLELGYITVSVAASIVLVMVHISIQLLEAKSKLRSNYSMDDPYEVVLNSSGRFSVNVAAIGVASVLDSYAIAKVFSLSPVRTSVALLVATASEVAVLAYTKTSATELVLVHFPLLITLAICMSFLVGLLPKPRKNQPEIVINERKAKR